uniref:hypothetical protein n=1 Tax=Rothia sp. HSID18067 TaxID=2419514 RepID=UPI00237B870A|nr:MULTISPECIES: hypothetical protein [Rothia]
MFLPQFSRWYTSNNRSWWHITSNYSPGTDYCIISNSYAPKDAHILTDKYPIPDGYSPCRAHLLNSKWDVGGRVNQDIIGKDTFVTDRHISKSV